MNPLILQERGYGLRLRGNTLDILDNHNNILESHFMGRIPYSDIIFQEPYGYLTLPALEFCVAHKVNVTIQNFKGEVVCQMMSGNNECHGELHLAQLRSRENETLRLVIAKEIIACKITTSSYIELFIHNYSTESELLRFVPSLKKAQNINAVLAVEAEASRLFWDSLITFYGERAPWARFVGRVVSPRTRAWKAQDPINAAENYAQWFTEAISRRVCNYVGLNKSLGWIHQIHDDQSKESTVYDLQEMIRWIGTLAVVQLVSEEKLTPQSFIVTDKYFTRLKKEAGRTLIERISTLLNTKVPYKSAKTVYGKAKMKKWSYENIFIDSGIILSKFLLKSTGARLQHSSVADLRLNFPSFNHITDSS